MPLDSYFCLNLTIEKKILMAALKLQSGVFYTEIHE
jgi:hypothetical protein